MKTATRAILILAILLSTAICQAEDNRDQDWAEDNPERMCDGCEIDYNDEDIARNDFNKVMNGLEMENGWKVMIELKGQHDGFPINAFLYLILVSVLGFALIAIIIFFCIKIFSGNDVIEDDEEAAIESNPESKERDDALSISNMETIIHILKGNIGIGVLTLPMALRNSGLIFGSLGLIFIAYLCVYCMMLLVNAAHRVRTRTECVPSTYCVK